MFRSLLMKGNGVDHQLFEEWIFSDQQLTPDQETRLESHLQNCQSCYGLATAWKELEGRLQTSPVAAPRPGFTQRWQSLRLEQRLRREKRQNLIALGSALVVASLLFVVLVSQSLGSVSSPAQLIVISFDPLLELIPYVYSLTNLASTVYRVAPAVTLAVLWATAMALVILCFLWILSIHQFAYRRRVV